MHPLHLLCTYVHEQKREEKSNADLKPIPTYLDWKYGLWIKDASYRDTYTLLAYNTSIKTHQRFLAGDDSFS